MKQSLLTFTLLSPVLAGIAAGAETPKKNKKVQEQEKPNVVIIYADDLGYGDLECYGAEGVKTPNVNKLASEGIRFTNMHAGVNQEQMWLLVMLG